MNITMTITAQNPEELFSTIKGCAVLISDTCPTAIPDNPESTVAPKTQPTNTASPAPTVSAPAPTPTAPALAPAPTTVPTAPQAPTVPIAPPPVQTYTYDTVGKAGADLANARPDLMPTLTALLQNYGVQAVTELKPEQLGPFAVELRQLGAKI